MKIKRPAIEILDEYPFSEDKLKREPTAHILTELVASIEEPFVLALEGGWGHGKTTFIEMWSRYLINEGYTCLSFNAWESDFAEDPLVPFISEIRRTILNTKGDGNSAERLSALAERVKDFGMEIAKRSIPVAAKLLTSGLVDLDKATAATAGDAIKAVIEEKFSDYENNKSTLASFQNSLKDFVKIIAEKKGKAPIVFFIDELDRCRPTFAIALLERIKHILNVEGILFVLAIDREQLLESVKAIYGQGTDASRYLRRFINLEYALPTPTPDAYPNFLFAIHGMEKVFQRISSEQYGPRRFLNTFTALSSATGMRLRDQEEAFSYLSIILRMLKGNEEIEPAILATMLVIKVARKDIYSKLLRHHSSLEEILELFKQHQEGRRYLSDGGPALEELLFVYLHTADDVRDRYDKISRAAQGVNPSPKDTDYLSRYGYILQSGSRREYFDILLRRLELADPFVWKD